MSTSREGPNPLRPYYIPPSVGELPTQNASSAAHLSSKHPTPKTNFGSSARNILADMDYSDYMSESSPSASGMGKALIEQAIRKYVSMFCVQPFEVGKTILQVQAGLPQQGAGPKIRVADDMRKRPARYRQEPPESYNVRKLVANVLTCADLSAAYTL